MPLGEFELAGDVAKGAGCGSTVRDTRRESAARDSRCASQSAPEPQGRTSATKALWAVGGFACFGLGVLGAVLPIIPTTPFLLAAAFFFARSSDKLNAWFKSTALYKRVLEGYATKRSMTVKAKLAILVPVTVLLAIGFMLMANVPVGRVVLAVVWIAHVIYFGFVVKTERAS
ncbi:YbaN family protein [Raoultibacter phocaeensis]|uniref:YbaN family protein n=1 Tax=Raoultibacter phocaeensis TaxID=2479841 RepID=UPI0011192779|nr:YbaN family protein [Raoultibacter phocaeensis]